MIEQGSPHAIGTVGLLRLQKNRDPHSLVRSLPDFGTENAPRCKQLQEDLFTIGRNHAPDTQVGSPHRIIPYRTSYRLLQGAHQALLASATVVPPVTLSEFIASKSGEALKANNVKSGTGSFDVAQRSRWVL